MRLLDRYIAKQFIVNVAALALMLSGFVIAIDVSINLDRFQRSAQRLLGEEEAGGLRGAVVVVLMVADLWWPRLLQLSTFMTGMIMVGAMGFTCVQLVRNREALAMLAAGVSVQRMLRPLFIVALGLTALQALNQELVIPRIAPLLVRDHGAAGDTTRRDAPVALTADGAAGTGGLVLRAERFDASKNELSGVFAFERGEDGRAVRVIRAVAARWRDGGWDLENGYAEARAGSAAGAGAPPVARTGVDRLETGIDPAQITMNQYRAFEQALSFAQVSAMLDRRGALEAEARARLERIRWGRFSVMACNLLAIAIAAPFFLSRTPTGILSRTLRALPVVSVALIGGVVGSTAAIPGLPPGVGVFVPALALLPVAVAALTAVRT